MVPGRLLKSCAAALPERLEREQPVTRTPGLPWYLLGNPTQFSTEHVRIWRAHHPLWHHPLPQNVALGEAVPVLPAEAYLADWDPKDHAAFCPAWARAAPLGPHWADGGYGRQVQRGGREPRDTHRKAVYLHHTFSQWVLWPALVVGPQALLRAPTPGLACTAQLCGPAMAGGPGAAVTSTWCWRSPSRAGS